MSAWVEPHHRNEGVAPSGHYHHLKMAHLLSDGAGVRERHADVVVAKGNGSVLHDVAGMHYMSAKSRTVTVATLSKLL